MFNTPRWRSIDGGAYMAQQRFKGQAGMGGRGKNQSRYRQDVATRRKRKVPALRKAKIPGSPAGPPARRNQKRNQRSWRAARTFRLKKRTRYPSSKLSRQ